MSSVESTLAGLGLQQKEITIYLALLSAGTVHASVLARHTKIPKSTVQFTCQQLADKGFIRVTRKLNAFLFTCEPPEKLLDVVQQRKHVLEQQEGRLKDAMTELKSLMRPNQVLPKMQLFEGREAIVELYERMMHDMREGEEVLSYLHRLDAEKDLLIAEAIDQFIRRRVAKKIPIRILSFQAPGTKKLWETDRTVYRDTRYAYDIPFEHYPIEMLIYGDTVVSITAEANVFFGSLVENKGLTAMYRSTFELAWRSAQQ